MIKKEDFKFNTKTREYELTVRGMNFTVPERNWKDFGENDIKGIYEITKNLPEQKMEEAYEFLAGMYEDEYFPKFLVDKIKFELENIEKFLKNGEKNIYKIQEKLDIFSEKLNIFEKEFEENDSEIETVAREEIIGGIYYILNKYNIEIELKDAFRKAKMMIFID